MKKILFTMLLLAFASPAFAELLVVQSDSQVHLSWQDDPDVLYYKISYKDLTDGDTDYTMAGEVFPSEFILSGMEFHHIYAVQILAVTLEGGFQYGEVVEDGYFTFAVDEVQHIKDKVIYAVTDHGWSTGVAICNSNDISHSIMMGVGNIEVSINVAQGECERMMLNEIVPDGSFPLTIDLPDGVGCSVIKFSSTGSFSEIQF